MKRADIISSIVIGELAALLMIAISRNITVPTLAARLVPWLPLWFPVFTLVVMIVGSFVGRGIGGIYLLTKFLLVGGLNFLIDLGVLNMLIAVTGISAGFEANVFKAVAFLVAVISSFIWNKFWTFGALSTEHAGKQFLQFFTVTAVGFFINVGAFAVFNDVLGPQAGMNPKTWASAAAAGAAIVGLIWNFTGYKLIVFRNRA